MNDLLQPILDQIAPGATDLLGAVQMQLTLLLLPSRLLQLGVAVALFVVALILGRLLAARLDQRMREQDGWQVWQLRALITLRRRVPLIVFVVLMWLAVAVFALAFQFPSRRYLLELIATIATAWLFIRLAATLVRNKVLRQIVVWFLTIYATLYFLDLLDETTTLLDSLAVDFGDFRLSALAIVKALVVTAILLTGARLVARGSASRIRNNADISPSMQELSVKAVQIALYSAAFFVGLKAVGFDLTGLAVLSGAIGVGLGFGLQKVVSNLVSGIIILLDKSVKPGDVISLGDTFGWINTLGARYVSVVTRDGKEYLIPNEDLITGQVVNWSHSNDLVRLDLTFGTAYGDDPHRVRALAINAAQSVTRVLADPAPVCHITGFGDSSVDYILRFWIRDPSSGLTNIRGHVYLALWDAFKDNGVSIPFPQREVRVLGPVDAQVSASAPSDMPPSGTPPSGTASSKSPG